MEGFFGPYLQMWKNFFKFSGRSRRRDYWMAVLVNFIVLTLLTLVKDHIAFLGILLSLYQLAVFIPTLSLTVRRFHDVSRSGWLLLVFWAVPGVCGLIALPALLAGAGAGTMGGMMASVGTTLVLGTIALVVSLLSLIYLVKNSTPGDNKYGPNPKEVLDAVV